MDGSRLKDKRIYDPKGRMEGDVDKMDDGRADIRVDINVNLRKANPCNMYSARCFYFWLSDKRQTGLMSVARQC